MLIIVEKDSAQSNDSAKNGTRKRSDTLPSASISICGKVDSIPPKNLGEMLIAKKSPQTTFFGRKVGWIVLC